MKQEEKDLLLKDLCARLPYGTFVYAQNADNWYDSEICTQVLSDAINEDYVIKPYLFPLSSMTQEQERNLNLYLRLDKEPIMRSVKKIDWFNKNHFDYRNLIERNLAIDCTNLNIY